MDKLIVVDYHEGAGGEFIARFLSAHYGHDLEFDQQHNPDYIQKWLNSNSIVTPEWDKQFPTFFDLFLSNCNALGITQIAIPYHLYKWPGHVDTIRKSVPNTRFVKINVSEYEDRISKEFQRKVLTRNITDFQELKFLLSNIDRDFTKSMLQLYKQGNLKYQHFFSNPPGCLQHLPSDDIEINYKDFFVNLDQTPLAYEKLCKELEILPNPLLLSALIERNKKNQQDLDNYLSTL